MTKFSIILGVLGLFATAAGSTVPQRVGFQLGTTAALAGRGHGALSRLVDCLPGVAAIVRRTGIQSLASLALLSSVVALLGVVFTDTAVRRLDKSGYFLSPFKYWLLGLAGLLPAWLITLWIIV